MPISLRDLRWDDLRLVLAISRRGSLAGAATFLQVNISTVSRRLVVLERALGHPLFDRTRDGVKATEAATRLLALAQRLEAEVADFADGPLESAAEGVVRIAAPPGIAEAFVIPAALTLRAQHPAIRLEVQAEIGVRSLDRRLADLAVRSVPPDAGGLVTRRVLHLPYSILGARSYVQEIGRVDRWTDARWIAWTQNYPHVTAARWFDRHVVGIDPVLRTNSFEGQLIAVRSGHGLAVLPAIYTDIDELVRVEIGDALWSGVDDFPADDVWLAADPAQKKVPRVEIVWRHLVEFARRMAPPSALAKSSRSAP